SHQPSIGALRATLRMAQNRASPVNEQRAQIRISAFADSEQRCFATSGRLPRHQPQPSGKLATIMKSLRVTNTGNERTRGERPDAGDRLQALARRILSMPNIDFHFEFLHLAMQRTKVI